MSGRSIVGGLIILAWLGTMAALVQRESGAELPALDTSGSNLFSGVKPATKWQDIDEWMLIVRESPDSGSATPIGAAHTSVVQADHPTSGAAYRAEFNLEGKISPLLPRVFVKGTALLDKDASLTKFYAKAYGVGLSLSALGEVHNKALYVKIDKPNGISYSRMRLAEPVSLSEVLRPSLNRRMVITPGAKMSRPVVDPLTGKYRGKMVVSVEKAETIDLDGKPIEAFRVRSAVGDIETLMWVDAEGRTLRRNLISGIHMERTTQDRALEIAPSLDENVHIPELDLSEFKNVPLESGAAGETDGGDTGGVGSGWLDAILG